MKKFFAIIALVFITIMANAQIVDNSYFDEKNYMYVEKYNLQIGDYLFQGSFTHGVYTLRYYTNHDANEAEALADLISEKNYLIQEKYGVKIDKVYVTDNVYYDYDHFPYRFTEPSTVVVIEIITDEYYDYLKNKNKERDERLDNLRKFF